MKFNLTVGLCDFLTGILLITFPEFILKSMFISEMPNPDVFLRYVGVFVMGTGLTYFLPTFLDRNDLDRFVWIQTSMIRYLVCFFVVFQVFMQVLAAQWLIVAATDGIIALIQTIFLFKKNK